MKSAPADGTPEEQERLAVAVPVGRIGNNNGSLANGKAEPPAGPRLGLFHSTRLFLVVFLAGWVMQGMFFTYFVGVITTIEKLFRIESKTTGTLLAATEIGQICTALLLTYAAGRGHRPRWIASMMLVLALGVIGCMVPHLAYGSRFLDVHLDAHRSGSEPLCMAEDVVGANATRLDPVCSRTEEHSEMRAVVIPWLFVCLLVVGVGQTGIATLGIPYIDDNVTSRRSPLYMAITIGIRVIGPALGFLLGALCTRVYVDPLRPPSDFDAADPRWVGAWWLGMVLVASFIVVLSLLMFCFPRQIRASSAASAASAAAAAVPAERPLKSLPSPARKSPALFKDFTDTIKRQLTNDILMCRTASSVLHLVPINGLYSFLPKYLETQFRLPPYEANLVSGIGGILVMGMGIVSAGVVILKLVPSARQVAAWTAATALIYSAGMVTLMFVSCPAEELAALATAGAGAGRGALLAPSCGAPCHCSSDTFSSVCGQDGVTYLSACHAGCRRAGEGRDGGARYFLQCACVNSSWVAPLDRLRPPHTWKAEPHEADGGGGYAVAGECGGGCWQFHIFLVLFAFIMFAHASGEVGSVLIIMRCTDPRDKAMAMGVIQFAIGVFGNVPCPIVFGAVVDAACYVKDSFCGVLGACAHYDNHVFRHYFLGLTGGIMFLAFLMDLAVWHKASRIDINPEESSARAAPDAASAPTDDPLLNTDTAV